MSMRLPTLVLPPEPCRFWRKSLRKDWSSEVSLDADPLLEVPWDEPRSLTSFWKAELRLAIAFEERLADDPLAAAVLLTTWLFTTSLMSVWSAAMRPPCV